MADLENITGNLTLKQAWPKLNKNTQKINEEIVRHRASEVAHAAEHITYNGAVLGANQIQQAIDVLKTVLDNMVVSGDSSPAANQAKVDTFGVDQPTLKDRLDKDYLRTSAQLAEKALEISELSETKAPITYTDARDALKRDKTVPIRMVDFDTEVKTAIVNGGGNIPVVGPDSTGSENLKRNSVTVPKVAFIDTGKNLFNQNSAVDGSYIDYETGNMVMNVEQFYSEFTEGDAGQTYRINKSFVHACFYSADEAFVSGHLVTDSGATRTFTMPLTCTKMIVSTDISNKATLQIEVGSIETNYEPYVLTVGDLKVLEGNFTSNTINSVALKDYVPGKNLFNKSTVTEGAIKFYATGAIQAGTNVFYSDYIAAGAGVTYHLNQPFEHVCYYDAAFNFLSGWLVDADPLKRKLTTPAGTAYIVISADSNKLDTLQLELGNSATPYEPYGYKLKDLLQPDSDYSYFDLAYIKDQRLVGNVNVTGINAKYTGVDMGTGKLPVSMFCKAVFNETGATIALISNPNGLNQVADILNKSLHIVYTDSFAEIGLLEGNNLDIVFTHAYATPCVRDGKTEYTFGWSIAADTLTLALPDGNFTYTDATMPEYMGQYCTLEHYIGNEAQKMPSFSYFSVRGPGYLLQDNFRRQNGAIGIAPTGQVYVQINEQTQTID